MAKYDRVQRQMDEMIGALHRASALLTIGYLLLFFDVVVACFVWAGLRVGSDFWLYWTVIQGVIGIALVGAALHTRSRMGKHLSRLDDVDRGTLQTTVRDSKAA